MTGPSRSGRTKISRTELAILSQLWEEGAATIRELTDRIYPDGTASNYATVQKLLDRLDEKGFVTRDRSARAHRFRATLSREEYISARLEDLADSVCAGSLTPLLTHLVRAERLSESERRELRELLGAGSDEDVDREDAS